MKELRLRAGDEVEVRSKSEILRTLDRNGRLEGLPFMPQMFAYCGQRMRVFKRAHKSCDTVNSPAGLKLENTVHLSDCRCDGSFHGGCQAGCLLFWKEAWLRRVEWEERATSNPGGNAHVEGGCCESDVIAATRSEDSDSANPCYVCQATRLPYAAKPLEWWDARQYVEDVTSGNVSVRELFSGLFYTWYYNLSRAGIGLGPAMRWVYDRVQKMRGGVPYPRRWGKIPAGEATPVQTLNLQPGEVVRVKPYREILATLNTENKNRGLYFDAEAVPYCGRLFRVARVIRKILDEKTGKMLHFKTPSIVLEGVCCNACYSAKRMFCPRSIDTYWREIWLERVPADETEMGGRPEPAPTVVPAEVPSKEYVISTTPPMEPRDPVEGRGAMPKQEKQKKQEA